MSGKVLFNLELPGDCAFLTDGRILFTDENFGVTKLIDKYDKVVWHKNFLAHHGITVDESQARILLKTHEFIEYLGLPTRSDCFLIASFSGERIKSWCLSRHIEELKSSGIDFYVQPVPEIPASISEYPRYEISHANTFYEIRPNSSANPNLRENNFIAVIREYPGLAVVLDPNLDRVVQIFDFSKIKIDEVPMAAAIHDVQVTESGNLLIYMNYKTFTEEQSTNYLQFIESLRFFPMPQSYLTGADGLEQQMVLAGGYWFNGPRGSKWYSEIVEYDPANEKVVWRFHSGGRFPMALPITGAVNQVGEGHLFFNANYNIVEVDRSGHLIQNLKFSALPEKDGKKLHIRFVRPLSENGKYLLSRGLIN